jgi:hypothetical protein
VHELASTAPGSLAVVMRQPSAIHPFVTLTSQRAIRICGLLVDEYGARAANVWADRRWSRSCAG